MFFLSLTPFILNKKTHSTAYFQFDSIKDLDADESHLMSLAIQSRKKAYAPYSKFMVGAAVLLSNGEVILGNNQENAAYPSGLCAERVAVYSAGAQYPEQKIMKIAISASSSIKKVTIPIAPCGACRQAIAEYEFKQDSSIKIYFMGESGKVILVNSLNDLLPFGFNRDHL